MSKWQPIETAPRDYTIFLAYFPYEDGDGVYDVVTWSPRHDAWASHDAGWGSERYGSERPGYWMPLPEPPE